MAAIKLPKLPKLPKLSGTQALLLLGGAFVLVVLAWTSSRTKLVRDWSGSAPENSVLSATILDRRSPDWAAFEKLLPEKARAALTKADISKPVTLFAIPATGGELDWNLLEASMSARNHGKIRLISKDVSVLGRLSVAGRETPFTASLGRGLIQARVGRGFRGIALDSNPFNDDRRLLMPLDKQSAYIEKPSGASWGHVSSALSSTLQRFRSQGDLWNLPGRLEMAVSASETEPLNPFLVYYKAENSSDLASSELENYAKTLLSESEPVRFAVTMPDDTKMTEFRLDPDSILVVRKEVGAFGNRARFSSPRNAGVIDLFSAKDGEAWLSNDLNLIQDALVSNVGAKQPTDSCETAGEDGFAGFSGPGLSVFPYLVGFERLTFSFHSLESGLFTTCGYFTP